MSEPEGEEYVWRFKLSDDAPERLHADHLTEMVRRQLRALLGCVILTDRGQDLKVTGFRFLEGGEENTIYGGATRASGPPSDADGQAVDRGGNGH